MSSPVTRPLKAKESDNSVSVYPCTTLNFDSSDFNITATAQEATITTSGSAGTIGGSITSTQVAFGAATANSIEGSAKLTWNDTAGSEQFKITGSGTTDAGIVIENTNTGVSSAPDLVLHRNVTGTTNDFIGRIDMRGQDSSSNDVDYLMMTMKIQDAANDAGRLGFFVAGNASLNADDSQLMIFGRTGLTNNPGLVSINNSARADVDFRVSGDTNTNIIRTDASQDNLGIGTAPTSGYSGAVPRVHVLQPDNGIGILVEDNQADDEVGPQVVWYRNSASPAVDDILGRLRWEGKDSGGNTHMYGRQTNQIVSPTDGSETGRMIWESRSLGTLYETMRFEGNDITFNYANSSAVDLLIKGANDNILFADASQDNLGIGTSAPSATTERLHVKGTGLGTLVRLESTDSDEQAAPLLELYRNSDTPAPNDYIGEILFMGNDDDDPPDAIEYTKIRVKIDDETSATEDGDFAIRVMRTGSLRTQFRIRSSEIIFNEDSQDCNFRVESDDVASMFKIDANENECSIGGNSVAGEGTLQVINDGVNTDGTATFNTYIVTKTEVTPLLTGAEVKNTLVTMDYSGGAATPTISSGSAGECVTILNINATQTVTVTAGVGLTFASTPAVLNQWESEKWVCYKANNWVRVANES